MGEFSKMIMGGWVDGYIFSGQNGELNPSKEKKDRWMDYMDDYQIHFGGGWMNRWMNE